MYFIQIFFF